MSLVPGAPPISAFVLVGATATGKSAVAHHLARDRDLAILSADSMLVYQGMDVGTAKPGVRERGGIPYFGIDLVCPERGFSTGDYLRSLRRARGRIEPYSGRLLAVGGTGLYVKALLEGFRKGPPADDAWRAEADRALSEGGLEALRQLVGSKAPGVLARVADAQNPRRLIRAVELASAGELEPSWGARCRVVGLRRSPADLRALIELRARRMFQEGLLDEARGLRQRAGGLSTSARQAIGYEEAFAVLDGRLSEHEAAKQIVLRTRRLAKRQMTWFRHQLDVSWIEVASGEPVAAVAGRVYDEMTRNGPALLHI